MMNLLFALNVASAASSPVIISFGHERLDTITFERQKILAEERATLTYRSASGRLWGRLLGPKLEAKFLGELRELTKTHRRSIEPRLSCSSPFIVEESGQKKSYCLDQTTASADREFGAWVQKVQKFAGVRR